jgi:hypothetical protein
MTTWACAGIGEYPVRSISEAKMMLGIQRWYSYGRTVEPPHIACLYRPRSRRVLRYFAQGRDGKWTSRQPKPGIMSIRLDLRAADSRDRREGKAKCESAGS